MAKELVYDVKAVVAIAISQNIVFVAATGDTRTSGWKNPELKPVTYVQPPPDGIQDFSFVATPPMGPYQPVLAPIATEYVWLKPPKWLKGVRVSAETNSKTVKIIKRAEAPQAKAKKAAPAKPAAKPSAKSAAKKKSK
jgi:hypothetical protein